MHGWFFCRAGSETDVPEHRPGAPFPILNCDVRVARERAKNLIRFLQPTMFFLVRDCSVKPVDGPRNRAS
jgi:hypothetical protein